MNLKTIQILALAGSLLSLQGCEKAPEQSTPGPKGSLIKVDGRVIEAPAGSKVTLEMDDQGTHTGPTGSTSDTSSARGVGLSTSSKDAEQNFKPNGVNAGFGPKGASGGGAEYAGKLAGAEGFNLFHALGALCLIGAAIYGFVTKRIGPALYIAAVGLGFIAIGVTIESYPIVWVAGVVLFIGLLGGWVYLAWKNKNKAVVAHETDAEYEFFGRVVTKAYDNLPTDEMKKAFREAMESASGLDNGKTREIVAYFRKQIGA